MDLETKRKDIPLADLKRQTDMGTQRGLIPIAENLARSEGESRISRANFDKDITYGSEGRKTALSNMMAQQDKAKLDNIKQFAQITASLLEEGMPYLKAGGVPGAQQFLQQKMAQLKSQGINLPLPGPMMDPRNWEQLHKGAIASLEHLRALELQDRKNAGAERVAQIGADARTSTGDKPERFNNAQAMQRYVQQLQGLGTKDINNPEVKDLLQKIIFTAGEIFDDEYKNAKGLAMLTGPNSDQMKNYNRTKEQYIAERLGSLGFAFGPEEPEARDFSPNSPYKKQTPATQKQAPNQGKGYDTLPPGFTPLN